MATDDGISWSGLLVFGDLGGVFLLAGEGRKKSNPVRVRECGKKIREGD